MKTFVALNCILLCAAAFSGCHNAEPIERNGESVAAREADTKMAGAAQELLRVDASIEDVKRRLGEPNSQVRMPDKQEEPQGPCEVALFYDYRPCAFIAFRFDRDGKLQTAIGPFRPLPFLLSKGASETNKLSITTPWGSPANADDPAESPLDFESATDFWAWEIGYNWTSDLHEPADRWTCVRHAITFLQMGMLDHPRSSKLAERMAWVFFHKIGKDLDDHSAYYRKRLALLLQDVVGDRENQNVQEWRDRPESAAARGLRENWAADRPDIMVEMEKAYGKFDWRLQYPHAIYWTRLAARFAPKLTQTHQLVNDRVLKMCLEETMRRGQIAYLGAAPREPLVTAYDFSKIAPLEALLRGLKQKELLPLPRNPQDPYVGPPPGDEHIQFLEEVQFILYFSGFIAEAKKYHLELHDLYDRPDPYVDLESGMLGRVKKLVDEYAAFAKMRGEVIDPAINRACIYLCTNKPHDARRVLNFARSAWFAFCEYTQAQAQDRIRPGQTVVFPTFEQIEREDVLSILSGRTPFPKDLLKPLRAALKIAEDADLAKVTITLPLVAPIPPDSPLPK